MIRTRFLAPALISLAAIGCTTAEAPQTLAPPYAPLVEGEPVPVTPHPDPESLLESDDPQLAANKRLAYDMWRTILNAGHVEAADIYLKEDYIQHNVTAPTGREAFKEIFSSFVERQEEIPETVQDPIVTIMAEGDYVVMAFVTEYEEPDGSGTYTSTHFDMFRIEDGQIAEHWDSVQRTAGQVPPEPEDGGPVPVEGLSGPEQMAMLRSDDPVLAANKRLIFDLWRNLPDAGREELAPLYVDPIYIQHNPNAATGRDGMVEYFTNRPDAAINTWLERPMVAMLAEGDLVLLVQKEARPDPNKPGEIYYLPWFDLFRIENGRAAEHWDTAHKGELPAVMQDQ